MRRIPAVPSSSDSDFHNRSTWERVVQDYRQKHLHPSERTLLERWRGRWHEVDMLDLGVGGGRTADVFAAITRRYVGIDYSAKMIDFCRLQYPEGPQVRFVLGDASDLSFLGEDKFDFILFSFNGIDYVSHDKRSAVLREVRARLKGADSLFLFSSHSLHCYPFAFQWSTNLRRPIRSLYRLPKEAIFNCRLAFSSSIPAEEAKQRGWAILNDGEHGFALSTYYVMPQEQIRQIEEAGLELVETMNKSGEPIDWREPQPDQWLYYLCRTA
jgi:SAM-dependent methyltransferase